MSWIEVTDYQGAEGSPSGRLSAERSREYCCQLEKGRILLFRHPPFQISQDNRDYLMNQRQSGSRLHKNISYRPASNELRGLKAPHEVEDRVLQILRAYSEQVAQFLGRFLTPYAGKFSMDYASFRPLEEAGRKLPLHKRNDLLHVDAFPSRPTHGGRILRVFTNLNPAGDRVWLTGHGFPELARRYAHRAGLTEVARPGLNLRFGRLLRAVRIPVPERSPYDKFMLRFHDFLKEASEFQQSGGSTRLDFPPLSTWLVFTDGVPHAVLSGQYALEQTFIIPTQALVSPEDAPIRVLEQLCEKKLA